MGRFLDLFQRPSKEQISRQTAVLNRSAKKNETLSDDPKVILEELRGADRGNAIKYLAIAEVQKGKIVDAEKFLRLYRSDRRLLSFNWQFAESEIDIAKAVYWTKRGNQKKAATLVNSVREKANRKGFFFNFEKTFVVRFYVDIKDLARAESLASSVDGSTVFPEVARISGQYLKEGQIEKAKACVRLLDENRWKVHLLVGLARSLKDQEVAKDLLGETEVLIPSISEEFSQDEVTMASAEAYAFHGMLSEAERILGDRARENSPYIQVEYAKFLSGNPSEARGVLKHINVAQLPRSTLPIVLGRMAAVEILIGDTNQASLYLRQAVDAATGIHIVDESEFYHQARIYTDLAKQFGAMRNKEGFEYVLSKIMPFSSIRGRVLVEYIRFLIAISRVG